MRYKRKTEEKLPNWFLAYAKLIRWFVFLTAIIGIVASLDLFLHGKVGVDQVEDIHWSDDTFQIGLKNHGSFDIPFIPQELNKEDSVEVYYSLFFQKVNVVKAVSSPFRHRVLFNNRYNLGILLFTLAILASIHIVVLNSDKVFVACIGTLDLLWFYLLIKLIVDSSPLF